MRLLKRYVIPLLFGLYLAACSTTQPLPQSTSITTINQLMIDEEKNSHLIGVTNTTGLLQAPFKEWFKKNYEAYEPKIATLQSLKKKQKEVQVLAFMGTWCGDSKREVPKFYKVAQQIGIEEDQIKMVNVYRDLKRYKRSPSGEEKGLNIHRVPTFIFYKAGKEIGRIVESPMTDMETDMTQILMGIPSKPRYQVVAYLNRLLEEGKQESIKEKEKPFGAYTARHTTSSSELNTYGYILLSQNKLNEAIQIFRINTLAYPKDANTFDSLGEAYRKAGNIELAKENYQKVIELEPDNETALKALEEIVEGDDD